MLRYESFRHCSDNYDPYVLTEADSVGVGGRKEINYSWAEVTWEAVANLILCKLVTAVKYNLTQLCFKLNKSLKSFTIFDKFGKMTTLM